jgi:alanine dehydrogenase
VALLLRESDVEELLSPADAVEAVEGCFARLARGVVQNRPRLRVGLHDGLLHVMAAADLELGVAGLKTYVGFREGARFVVALFASDRPELLALIDADRLGQRRTGAASAVAARHLARPFARSLEIGRAHL